MTAEGNRIRMRKRAVMLLAGILAVCMGFCCMPGRTGAEEAFEADAAQETVSKTSEQVLQYGMVPIGREWIENGTYSVEGRSSSRFFVMHDMILTVTEEGMQVTFYIDSSSYSAVYAGTAGQAEAADESDRILAQTKDGRSYFTLPIEALNEVISCAAYSRAKQRWYDRDLLFLASSLPEEALHMELPDYDLIEAAVDAYESGEETSESTDDSESHTKVLVVGSLTVEQDTEQLTAVTMELPDGSYSIETALTGGSGRASVSSPTYLTIRDGQAYATILWSSTHYDYMILDGVYFYNEAEDGGISRFTIPVTKLDEPMDIIADTTAMGEPVEISYTLTFYGDSVGDTGLIPQEAAKRVLAAAVVIIAAGGILNHILKKRRKRRR